MARYWPCHFRVGSTDYIQGIPTDPVTGLRLVMHLALLNDEDHPFTSREYLDAGMSMLSPPYSLCMLLQDARIDLTPCTWLIREEP